MLNKYRGNSWTCPGGDVRDGRWSVKYQLPMLSWCWRVSRIMLEMSWIWDDLWRILEYTAHIHDQGEDNGKEQLELKTLLVHFDILLPLTGAV